MIYLYLYFIQGTLLYIQLRLCLLNFQTNDYVNKQKHLIYFTTTHTCILDRDLTFKIVPLCFMSVDNITVLLSKLYTKPLYEINGQ